MPILARSRPLGFPLPLPPSPSLTDWLARHSVLCCPARRSQDKIEFTERQLSDAIDQAADNDRALEQQQKYIDSLLVKVLEKCPEILQSQ